MCKLYAKIIAESELLQLALNEIHKFCFQHWSRGRRTCGTGSGAPGLVLCVSVAVPGESCARGMPLSSEFCTVKALEGPKKNVHFME